MSESSRSRRLPLGRVLYSAALLAGAVLIVLALGLAGSGAIPQAAGQAGGEGEPTPQTDDSVPAIEVTFFGTSPAEAPEETWGLGRHERKPALVRYTSTEGWSLGPDLLDSSGGVLPGFKLAQPESFKYRTPSPLAGSMTANGSGALLGSVANEGGGTRKVLLTRNPGGPFRETEPVPSAGEGALLGEGESLFAVNRAPMVAALDEGSHAGALVVPVNESGGVDRGVLHWDGSTWTREPIEIPAKSSEQLEVLAMAASSPGNAWLLARLSSEYPAGSVALFRRHLGGGGETPTWRAVAIKAGGEAGEPLAVEGKPFTVPSGDQAQVLTATEEGLWIDGLRRDVQAPTTLYLQPQGEAQARVQTAWCLIPGSAPEGTQPCPHNLPRALPTGPNRSYAWPNSSTPEGLGERVITGLPDGLSLRLEGTAFKVVLGLGGDTGASYGAAFSDPHDGWLGKERLPVHVTSQPVASRLTPWPVSFRNALLALAPQPGAPVGALSSEALAVGDRGEVARYRPGRGWLPESLLGPGGRRETPRLRALAWPTPTRAYAVGDLNNEGGIGSQMWLWRGETGLWERDPAVPLNFRGNLLGIAFDPNNSSRGYTVGPDGVLLSYGKSWTQVPEASLPAEARGASFTSIAFAGSEAIVAYRKLLSRSQDLYQGGLLVNDGSGWRIDSAAAAAIGSDVPWAVAGLPDGGAAFTAAGPNEDARIFERQSAGSAWQPDSLPGGLAPGSIALFRDGGALRAVVSGAEPATIAAESEAPPPAGLPPTPVGSYPIPVDSEHGVLRQTATGWSDEEHDLNNAKEPPGEYLFYDTVFQPDPVAAVLVDQTGSQGWAVGGIADNNSSLLETADVDRYPADGSAPVGLGSAPVVPEAGTAAFAIGGGAQCAAPCADRAATGIGPDTWLSAALSQAGRIAGVRAFLYTGGRVTSGQTAGPAELVVPYANEEARYAELLGASPLPSYVVPSPTDLDGAHSEGDFQLSFSGFNPPPAHEPCAGVSGCQGSYYAMESTGSNGSVRVIVLDDTGDVASPQLEWLAGELAGAKSAAQPAIVVGHADLEAQIAEGDSAAVSVAQTIVEGGASAYFFDSPEQNVQQPLRFGARSIPSFGSGTLGYVNYIAEERRDFIGASGFLLTQVNVRARNPSTNVAPVTVQLIPDVSELSMEAKDGTLLRRSRPALFYGLARRPRSGNRAHNKAVEPETSPYIPVGPPCVGVQCAKGVFPEYKFTSSRPDIGDFVEPNPAAADPHTVKLAANGKPIADAHSPLFCAYNAGTTIVTLSTGGLSYSLPVTVQAGSVAQPCGTTPLTEVHPSQSASVPTPAPAPGPAGPTPVASSSPVALPPPPPPPPVPAPPPVRAPALPNFFAPPPQVAFLPVFVPVPVPSPARPTPPSGTSAVTSPVEAPQREEEEEAAPDSVSNQAVAYTAAEHDTAPAYLLGIVVLAALAGVPLGRRRRGRRRELAHASISAGHSQRGTPMRRARRPDRW